MKFNGHWWIKFVCGAALLPACAALALTLVWALSAEPGAILTDSAWGLLIGFFLWLFLFMVFPKPVRAYVWAHELTHVLWAWLLGGKVSDLRVGPDGGSVRVDTSHFLITLAPYFFPLYTALVLLVYGVWSMFFDLSLYAPFWAGCVGVSWSFHLTFTIHMLWGHQPDIREQGSVFSYTLICLINMAFLLGGLTAVTPLTTERILHRATDDLIRVYRSVGVYVHEGVKKATTAMQ